MEGYFGRTKAVKSLMDAGRVTDPSIQMRAALPDADIKVSRWGLRYFPADWERYQVVFDAKIMRGETKTRCRETSTQGPVGAPTLNELLSDDGGLLQQELTKLAATCAAKAG